MVAAGTSRRKRRDFDMDKKAGTAAKSQEESDNGNLTETKRREWQLRSNKIDKVVTMSVVSSKWGRMQRRWCNRVVEAVKGN